MEQSVEKAGNIKSAGLIKKYRGKYDDKVLSLIQRDIEYGIEEDRLKIYLDSRYNYEQMKVFSDCLIDGNCDELIEIMQKNDMSEHHMKIAVEFYKRGVPIESIGEVVGKKYSPVVMKKILNEMYESIDKSKSEMTDSEKAYTKELLGVIDKLVKKFETTQEKYNALNEQILSIADSKADDEIRQRLIAENDKKDAMLENQQDQIMKAGSEIEKLKKELGEKKEEIVMLKEQLDKTDTKITAKSEDVKSNDSSDSLAENQQSIPVYYSVPVKSLDGSVQRVLVERQPKRKTNQLGMFARFGFKKKSKADLVRLIASGELVPAQIEQIKNAMVRGLTESQLLELINNNVPAEKMKGIIEIAILENSMKE